jgi:beta-galactosidase
MVQVENEYGSYGSDKVYMGQVRDQLLAAGFTVPLFHCDGPSQMRNDAREDIFSVVNFGSNPKGAFDSLRRNRALGPLMCGEFYPGWFDSWGKPHHRGPTDRMLADLRWMLEQRGSFSMYMAHGGTTFGLWSGANSPPYVPQTSSYDYDAPIGEQGNRTEKFDAMRKLFAQFLNPGETIPDPPAGIPIQTFAQVRLTESTSIFSNLPRAKTIKGKAPLTFEANGLGVGCAVYSATIPAGTELSLQLTEVHDFAWIYIDGVPVGKVDRRIGDANVGLPNLSRPARLDVVVEAMGRVNYGGQLHDRKGFTKAVLKGAKGATTQLTDWTFSALSLESTPPSNLHWKNEAVAGPAFWRGTFKAAANKDTWLDVHGWSKGMLWVNGHNLGRFWNIGPTQTMFLPGCWLKDGDNDVVVLDFIGPTEPTLAGLNAPVLDEVRNEGMSRAHRKPTQQIKFIEGSQVAVAQLAPGTDWQEINFSKPVTGRYLALEVLSAQDDQAYATLAELEAVGTNGTNIPRTSWKTAFADSEELESENGSADNIFDLQPTTYWHTRWQGTAPKHPHLVILDLGSSQTLTGLRLQPRQDMANGRIKDCRVYLSKEPFSGQ